MILSLKFVECIAELKINDYDFHVELEIESQINIKKTTILKYHGD